MDFIEKLPPSPSYTSILVIVDHLSKQALFILTQMSQQFAQLFILHVSPSMVSQAMSPLTMAWNLFPTSSGLSGLLWTRSFTSLPDIILKVRDRPNGLIRL